MLADASMIADLARQLRMGTRLQEVYREIPFESHEQYVVALLEELLKNRQQGRTLRLVRRAGFECEKRLEQFSPKQLGFPTGFNWNWLCDGAFLEAKQNLILMGNPGTGKTHLATALGIAACMNGRQVLYRRTTRFIEELTRAFETGQYERFKEKLDRLDLLILDEWGYIPVHTNGTRLLFDVISDCYEKRSVILTTNLPLPEWNRIFGDERLLSAMVDRLMHHGIVIRHMGESYRLKESPMN